MIHLATDWVKYDEPCFGLYELNFKTPDEKARHRYQICIVLRGDQKYEYRKDLGDAKKFKGIEQIRIPGGLPDERPVETVGRLMDIANTLRSNKLYDPNILTGLDKVKIA